jgi:hypothetical protein
VLTPPTGGTYNLFIASDDASQLLLSLTTNPASASVYASVPGWTDRQKWSVYSSQRSANLSLVAGQQYYLEALHKEASGADHLEIAWTGPGLSGTPVITGSALTPVDINYAPDLTNCTLVISPAIASGTRVPVVWAQSRCRLFRTRPRPSSGS